MKTVTRIPRRFDRRLLSSAVAACLLAAAPQALSQSASATLRGQVSAGEQPVAAARVVATNTETGLTRRVQTEQGGNYTLAGLRPGTYKIEVTGPTGATARLVTLQVGQTATLHLGLAAAENIESVTVVATQLYETRTSEVATYVTPRQIEALPQNSRNFLAFADIVPGVQFVTSADGATSEIRSGAQSANGVNVFIDGVGQKNYVLRGGVSGQTLSRGNPFPQLAIGEYKVITSNYKAEFDQLSSAAVVAVTRSGTNEFESKAFFDHTAENWRASDPIEARDGRKAQSEQEQYGVAFGGPIIRDKMHFFVTYEGKEFETPETVTLGQGIASSDAPPELRPLLGVVSAPFDEDLYFAKIDWSVADDHLLELSGKRREESEISNIGDQNTAAFASDKRNEETRLDLRYQFTSARLLNDAHITYEDAKFNPRPVNLIPGYRATTADRNQLILNLGGGADFQDKGQKGWGFQDDVTFTAFEWLGAHTVKTGFKYKRVEINAFEQQPFNPQFSYDVFQDPTTPYLVQFGAAIPGLPDRNVTSENRQYGIYLQDDWEVTQKLLLNLGVRYDYEETPSYLDYVTPGDVIAGLNSVDTSPGAAPGQTYAQSLALGGVDVNKYLSNGHNRDPFDGGIQPRVGFSYDFSEDESFVLFGGAGRAYDRNVFEYLALERSKGTFPTYERVFNVQGHPCDPATDPSCLEWDPAFLDRANLEALVAANPNLGREINLINNDLKTPYSDQFSLGVRNRFDLWSQSWNTSATVAYVESKDGIVFQLGNRRGDGSYRENPLAEWEQVPFGNGIPGLGSLIIINNGIESRATSLLLSAEKPYTGDSSWGVTIAYTLTDAEENRTNAGLNDEHFILDYPTVHEFGWHTATGVPMHRLVATGIWDGPWKLMLSAKLLLQSPVEFEALNCRDVPSVSERPAGLGANNFCFFQNFKPDTTIGRKQFDLAAQKGFDLGDFSVSLRADVLNVFNWDNPNTYENFRGFDGVTNPAFGQATSFRQPTRTFKLSFNVGWR